jgi:predicted lipoprotein with Yx(FWY)xxD motif
VIVSSPVCQLADRAAAITAKTPMTPTRVQLAVLTGAALASAAGASPGRGATALASSAPTVRLEQTDAGKILVDGSGSTVYIFTRDRGRHDSCAKVPGCTGTWPALTTTRRPVAGPGLRAGLLGTIKFRDARWQVTYAGHPLYTDSHDFGAGSTLNVGQREYGGYWYAIAASGSAVR